ncbi:PREDICTED: uncharacterized protein LOC104813130 [Tarenaya hassleriana]|uniref:uncharacterized protein LOC104813130 n=1 Tax=Tarenaya hassleriana TaxID=28532 RepID=UPI00053C2421|nr:PREDICTED: uncharacterized protein LOC104813130 [Tarenaya hassleriana]XP_010538963.1 PREDICTED: uncharacterized protein LOC104813130 [Tarenaya hassleriana]XP_010538964.1 PREDICTED: uncharacterized protein LOC104813130 [Tarenaya hassleriana]
MGKVKTDGCKSGSLPNQANPYRIKKGGIRKGNRSGKHGKGLKRKAWKGVTCPVCLEIPHNTVLLLCSSYHKGCRPYMCETSSRFSNCLEQYKKAYTKEEKTETPPQLLCPFCRGQVKGWTVDEDARKYLNSKKRACLQDNCTFVGSYKQLQKHVKAVHPRARPRAVDPVLEEKWKELEFERERSDVISTIISSTPGAMVLGDYVIEPYNDVYDHHDDEDDDLDSDSEDSLDDGGLFDLGSFRGQNDLFRTRHSFVRQLFSPRSRWVRSRGASRSGQTQGTEIIDVD